MKKEDFKKIPIKYITELPLTAQFTELVRDCWWACTDDDCVLLYKGRSRQCNSNKAIVEQIIKNENHPATKIVFIPIAFMYHDCNDFVDHSYGRNR